MRLYINGDSHSAGTEAVNDYDFSCQDPKLNDNRFVPHPDNLQASYGEILGHLLNLEVINHSYPGASNSRIIRTTREYLDQFTPDAVVIGWSTWEREEWLYNDVYWQVNMGGIASHSDLSPWPKNLKERYKEYIVNLDWNLAEKQAHDNIHQLHIELLDLKIPHLFFNTLTTFAQLPDHIMRYNWGDNYIRPYDQWSYTTYLDGLGHVKSNNHHFDADAHRKWAEFLLPHLTRLL